MPYAVVQQELEPPQREVFCEALAASGAVTHTDVAIMGRNYFGILARGMSLEAARAFQAALAERNVPAEVVDQAELLPLPPSRRITRVACGPEFLTLCDLSGSEELLAWNQLAVLAAGQFTRHESKDIAPAPDYLRTAEGDIASMLLPTYPSSYSGPGSFSPSMTPPSRVDVVTRHLILNICTQQERFTLDSRETTYAGLGDRIAGSSERNFILLLADLQKAATSAWLNRGFAGLVQDPPSYVAYENNRFWQDEVAWLLWKARQG